MPDITIVLDVDPNKAIQRSLNDKNQVYSENKLTASTLMTVDS